jgi:hypothetical protein
LALGGYFAYHRKSKGDAALKRQTTSPELQGFHNPNGPNLKKAGSALVEMSNPEITRKMGSAVV